MLASQDDEGFLPESIDQFDRQSGSFFERLLFNNRGIFLLICLALTVGLGFKAIDVRVNADYNQMIPTSQSYIANYLRHYNVMQSQSNAVQIAVTADKGTIINPQYLSTLEHLSDEVYLLPGVDRPFMTSLWTSNERWMSVTAAGFSNGAVISGDYDGSPQQLAIVQSNIFKTGKVGTLVSPDFTSSMIYVPLLEFNNLTGKPLNYGDLARRLNDLRTKYAAQGVTLHIIGFAMVVGDMINAIDEVLVFFGISIVIATCFLFWYTRCVRSTLLVVFASLTAVIWQMGFLKLLGFDLTPYSVLVPFLVFAIGMSHGAQKMNGVMQDIGRGTHPLVAARYTFRRLFLAGFAALVCDMTSFAVLLTIKIVAIQQSGHYRQYRRWHSGDHQSADGADDVELYRCQPQGGGALATEHPEDRSAARQPSVMERIGFVHATEIRPWRGYPDGLYCGFRLVCRPQRSGRRLAGRGPGTAAEFAV